MNRYLLAFFPALFLLFASTKFVRAKGFSPEKITSSYPYDPSLLVEKTPHLSLFNQPFYYLDSGTKCYAFASEDGQYVIKFFKQNHMKKHLFSKDKSSASIEFRKHFFSSIQLAYEKFADKTGLIYIHLTPSNCFDKKITLIDQKGKCYQMPLDSLEFLVQKRTRPVFDTLDQWMQCGSVEKAKRAISSILELIKDRCDCHLLDHDVNCRKNIGLSGTEALEIDVGEFKQAPPSYLFHCEQEMRNSTVDLADYLYTHYPALYDYLQSELHSYGQVIKSP